MRYHVSEIPQGSTQKLHQSFLESPEHLGFRQGEIYVEGNIEGQLTLWRDGAIVTIQGDISTSVSLQCCRCLAMVMTSLNPIVALRCLPELSQPSPVYETDEVKPEDSIYTYAGGILDLRPVIREQVILAVPPYSYCRSDCQGLCVECGQDLNSTPCGCFADHVDARFAALQHLKQIL